jgi:hypothetical protein
VQVVLAIVKYVLTMYILNVQGRFTIAAKHHMTIAEIYETDIMDLDQVQYCTTGNIVFCELIRHDSVCVYNSYVEPFSFLKKFVAHCYSMCLCNLMWFRPLSTMATLVTIIKGKSRPAPPINAG